MGMYPGPSYPDHPTSEELSVMEVDPQIHKVLDLGVNPKPGPSPVPLCRGIASVRVSTSGPVLVAFAILSCHTLFLRPKTRCSSYVCPGSSWHTYGQNVSTEYQCLYYIISYYKNLLQVQKGLNSGMDPILPQAVDRGFRTPRRNLHQRTPHPLSSRT
jgi:hypothetical protein